MKSDAKPHVNISDALQLDGNPDSIARYYKRWAATYDADVIDNYYGIKLICELLHQHVQTDLAVENKDIAELSVVDVGCGTGLNGSVLHGLGYTTLTGVDLSAEMIAKAEETGDYQQLFAGVNIHDPLPENLRGSYDAAICVGVFTPGHVLPESLYQIADMVRPGGLIIVSTRVPYYNTTEFQQVSDDITTAGIVELIKCYWDAPYRDDGDAHYWVYRKRAA